MVEGVEGFRTELEVSPLGNGVQTVREVMLASGLPVEQAVAMLQRLRAPFFVDGSEVFASASIGVSLYPDHGRS